MLYQLLGQSQKFYAFLSFLSLPMKILPKETLTLLGASAFAPSLSSELGIMAAPGKQPCCSVFIWTELPTDTKALMHPQVRAVPEVNLVISTWSTILLQLRKTQSITIIFSSVCNSLFFLLSYQGSVELLPIT